MKTTLYLHSSKDDMIYIAETELELSKEAASSFRYALYEVEFDVEVNPETGNYEILEVRDGHRVLRPVKEYEELVPA